MKLRRHFFFYSFMIAVMAVATCSFNVSALTIKGIVRDSLTLQGIPYASLRVPGTAASTVADRRGLFELTLPPTAGSLTASCQGYSAKSVPIKASQLNLYDIMLTPVAQQLKELVVKKSKYSKQNNPAVDFAVRLRNSRHNNDPRRNPYYSFDSYQRISMGLHDFDTTASQGMLRHMPQLIEHVDTSLLDGKPVLNLVVRETTAKEYFRNTPKSQKKITTGTKSAGIDEFVEPENMQAMLEEVLRDVDLYEGTVRLLRNNFVSPLAKIAPDFYRFYLVDSTAVLEPGGPMYTILAFYPRNKSSLGFSGHLYVANGDTSMTMRRIEMGISPEINLNFINHLKIIQEYDSAPDGSRLKTKDDLLMDLSFIDGTPKVYINRRKAYRNHSFEKPEGCDTIFDCLGSEFVQPQAANRNTVFWRENRQIDLPRGEQRIDSLMPMLHTNKLLFYSEKLLRIMVEGYVRTGNPAKFAYGPVGSTASYNSLEGLRLRAGGFTTAQLSPHWFGRGYVAHGFKDHRWKYGAEAEYSFNAKKYHAGEFPIHSVKLWHSYDVDHLGSRFIDIAPDNFVMSLARQGDRKYTYRLNTKLTYTLELQNHLSIVVSAENERQEATRFLPFIDGNGKNYGHFTENILELSLRFSPGETFYQSRSRREPINEDAPVFSISHRFAPRGFGGSRFGVNRTELSAFKMFRLSFLGEFSIDAHAGHVWGPTVFTQLFIPNANLSYTIQPRSFALMNPMEFINSSYVSWHATWQLRGALFNLVPLLKRAGLREVVSLSGLYGRLAKNCTPGPDNPRLFAFPTDAARQKMTKPYMELSVGLDNILHLFRIDYVWRLNYRDVPYNIDRSGVRVALHLSF